MLSFTRTLRGEQEFRNLGQDGLAQGGASCISWGSIWSGSFPDSMSSQRTDQCFLAELEWCRRALVRRAWLGYGWASLSNLKRSVTGIFSRLAIFSRVSNEGALIPRSTRLRKSTDRLSVSAKRS